MSAERSLAVVPPSGLAAQTPEVRFWRKVDRSAGPRGCWLWTGGTSQKGYGRFALGRKMISAHRYAYEIAVGPIPDGLEIDHVKARGCQHRHCVNPAHMEAVTGKVNTLRGESPSARHARQVTCALGHEFTAENTYRRPDGRRVCRACRRRVDAGRGRRQGKVAR